MAVWLYVASGRSDAQWATGGLAKAIENPEVGSMKKLKKAVRYLIETGDMGTLIDATGSARLVEATRAETSLGTLATLRGSRKLSNLLRGRPPRLPPYSVGPPAPQTPR